MLVLITLTETEKSLLNELKHSSSETYFHSLRVKNLAVRMIALMQASHTADFSRRDTDIICKGALLHDIGKLYTKNVVLTKASSLSETEREHMKSHTRLGYEAICGEFSEDEREILTNILLYHHERVDGSGYEHRTDLPLYVQIVAICDVFDAIHSDRSYHDGLKTPECLKVIRERKSGTFDKAIIDCLEQATQSIE